MVSRCNLKFCNIVLPANTKQLGRIHHLKHKFFVHTFHKVRDFIHLNSSPSYSKIIVHSTFGICGWNPMMLPYYSNKTGLFGRIFGKGWLQTYSIFKLFVFCFFKFLPKNRESIGHPYPLKELNKPGMSFHFKFIYLWNWSFQVKGENHFEVVQVQKRRKLLSPSLHMFSLRSP